MALTVNTTLIPGQTIVTDDITGGIAIVPPNYSNVYQQIVTALSKIAPVVLEDTTASITDDVVTLSSALASSPVGCFVEADGILADTYIVDYYSTELAPETFEYFCKLSKPVSSTIESVSVRFVSSNIMLVKQLMMLNELQTAISDTQTSILETHQGIKTLGEGNGFHIVGPWEWLGMSSIVKLYKERGVDLVALKAEVDAVPKSI